MTTQHYTTITPAELMTMTVDDVIELANVAGDHLANAEATRIMYALVVRSARITMEHATESANVHGGSYVTYAENAGRTYADVMAHWLGMWTTTPTPTPTPTPTYTAVGLPVMVQDGPCDVAECNGVPIASDIARSHRDMVDLWVMDFDIASYNHDTYHVATTHPISGDMAQWLVARCGKGWQYTPWVDVHPTIKATIWAGDMADKLATAGIDLATLATPEYVHCAIAQWLVDVDGCNPYDVDGMMVQMMIGLHSPVDVAEKTIEDWYQRWLKLNAEPSTAPSYKDVMKWCDELFSRGIMPEDYEITKHYNVDFSNELYAYVKIWRNRFDYYNNVDTDTDTDTDTE
jgi:hypothetical protein